MTYSWLPDEQDEPLLSVILPSYSAGLVLSQRLPNLVRFLRDREINYEIVVCDDTGDGGEPRAAKVAAKYGAAYIAHEENKGKGAAVRTGMLAAKGKYRLFTDADVPFDSSAIVDALYCLIVDGADVVVGDRRLSHSHYYEAISTLRRAGSWAFTQMARPLFGAERFDTQCGFKAFEAETAKFLFSRATVDRFAMDVEILLLAVKTGRTIAKIPVSLTQNEDSTVHLAKDGMTMTLDIAKICWRFFGGHYHLKDLRAEPLIYAANPCVE
jgi:dolichyl-phosphate beta-glucosyltransferase